MATYLGNKIADFFFDVFNLDVNLQLLRSRWLSKNRRRSDFATVNVNLCSTAGINGAKCRVWHKWSKVGWRHLVNAYEKRQAWCNLQVKLCDPCLSALRLCVCSKWRYINTLPFLSFLLSEVSCRMTKRCRSVMFPRC